MKMQDPNIFEKVFNKLVKPKDDSNRFKKISRISKDSLNPQTNDIYLKITTPDESEYRKLWLFKNGYGISVIRGFGTYGASKGLFEIAVMKDGKCCFKTPITDDVIGHLTANQVLNYGKIIMKLKEVNK